MLAYMEMQHEGSVVRTDNTVITEVLSKICQELLFDVSVIIEFVPDETERNTEKTDEINAPATQW